MSSCGGYERNDDELEVDSPNPSTPSSPSAPEAKMSKNQLKRLRRKQLKKGGKNFQKRKTSNHPSKKQLNEQGKRLCWQCDQVARLKMRSNYACVECFLHRQRSAFRGGLKALGVQLSRGQNVLVAFSGGLASRAMLDLVSATCTLPGRPGSQPRKGFEYHILNIDESAVLPGLDDVNDETGARKRGIQDDIKTIADQYGVNFVSVPLEQVFSLPIFMPSAENNGTTSMDMDDNKQGEKDQYRQQLIDLFSKLADSSDKQDLAHYLRLQLYYHYAKQWECSKVLLGDCCDAMATKIIANTSKGRGFALSFDVASIDDTSFPDVHLVYPLRDQTRRMITLYSYYSRLDQISVNIPSFVTRSDVLQRRGINFLSQSFIAGLTSKFENTVFQVLRTSERLQKPDIKSSSPSSSEPSSVFQCRLCLRYSPSGAKLTSIVHEQYLSKKEQVVRPDLCYGCNRLVTTRECLALIPQCIICLSSQEDDNAQSVSK